MPESRNPIRPILIVDDEEHALNSFNFSLAMSGYDNTLLCQDGRNVFSMLGEQEVELVILDLLMPHVSGREILSRLVEDHPDVPVIVVTGVNDVGTVVECMREGAFDYLLKPIDRGLLVASVRRALELGALRRQNAMLSERLVADTLEHPEAFSKIITINKQMLAIFRYCEVIAPGNHPVLISGETEPAPCTS